MSSNYSTYFQNHTNQGNSSYKIFNCNETTYNLQNVWKTYTVVGSLYRRTSVSPTMWQALGYNVWQITNSNSANNTFSYVNQFYYQDFLAGISNVPRTANSNDGGFYARRFNQILNGGFYYSTYPAFHSNNDVLGINLLSISTPTINVQSSNLDDGKTEWTFGHIYVFQNGDMLQDPGEEEVEEEENEEDDIAEEDENISSYQVCLMKCSDSDIVLDDTSVSYADAIFNNYKISGDKAYVISRTIS